MIYIKMDTSMNLTVTVREPIYRGDNLSQKIIFLIPLKVDDMDIQSSIPYLYYVRADGIADMVALERLENKYKESYYQYVLPVSCKLSKCAGEVSIWIQIYSGDPSEGAISESGKCFLYIEASDNIDDHLCEHQLTALNKTQSETEKLTEMLNQLDSSLSYDSDTNKLSVTSDAVQRFLTLRKITLTVDGWDDVTMQQEVECPGVLSDVTSQCIMPYPVDTSYESAWNECGVLCIGQSNGSLIFQCEDLPTIVIDVYIVILPISYS